MKKFLLLIMSTLFLSLAISCDKDDNNELVGGEDVTNPLLNPGGKLMDHGVNIVGAWALCNPKTTFLRYYLLIDSKGNVKQYWLKNHDDWENITLDVSGILHTTQDQFKYISGDLFGSSMLEIFYNASSLENDSSNFNNWIDEKHNRIGYSYVYSGIFYSFETIIESSDKDTFILYWVDYKDGHETDKGMSYLRRIKDFI